MARLYLAVFFAAAVIAPAVASEAAPPTFAAKPTVTKAADGEVKIAFAVSAPTDVEVAVLGADGKVVRHLAAGVLGGEKPPPPPLRPGLAQDLTWDGKGDWGLPAGNGPFRVRVRLGMRAKIGRLIGDSHYNFNGMICRGMLTDPRNGDLYLLLTSQDAGTMRYSLRVYDRDGNYLREILPYPAGLDERSRGIFGSLSLPGMARPVPRYYNSYPTIYPFDLSPFDPEQESTAMVWRQFSMAA
ncbi:MAG: hypothetical protein N3A38_16650, partial [Planctomycetota bacterium]|nr:hypothetical protein [Planctomycetota bacterium]